MRILSLLLALVLAGCSGCNGYPTIPRQQEATDLVWAYFGGPGAAPQIEWIEQEDLDCGMGDDGVFRGFYRRQVTFEKYTNAPKECVAGVFWRDEYLAQVAHPFDFGYIKSAFSHELYHAYLFRTTGSGNGEHTDPGFKPGGAVDQANANLAGAGIIK